MTNTTISPDNFNRRSFLYRKFAGPQTSWSTINDYAIVSSHTDVEKEIEFAHHLAISDLSYLQRIGFKGVGTCEWLERQNIAIPTSINASHTTDDNCLVSRLGNNDILILDSIKNQTNVPDTLAKNWHQEYSKSSSPCGYIMPRQDTHACFCVSGVHAAEMFAKLCAIDLRENKFENNMISQTSLARLGTIIVRHDFNALNAYIVFVESASAEYGWDCLVDAMQEFDGQIIGASALQKLS